MIVSKMVLRDKLVLVISYYRRGGLVSSGTTVTGHCSVWSNTRVPRVLFDLPPSPEFHLHCCLSSLITPSARIEGPFCHHDLPVLYPLLFVAHSVGWLAARVTNMSKRSYYALKIRQFF